MEPSTMSETVSIAFDDMRWLHRFARHMAQDPHDADDLVQDTLLTAWQRPPQERETLRPWLGKVLRNRLRMRRRSDVRRDRRESEHMPAPAATAAPDQELARVRVLRHLAEALEQLPPQDQRLIVRRFFEGQSAADIGRALDMPAATIRSRIHRSLERLRARLDERCDGRNAWCAAVVAIPIPGEAMSLAKPAGGKSMLIKSTVVAFALGGIAAGVWVVQATGDDDEGRAVVAETEQVAAEDQPGGSSTDSAADKQLVMAAADAEETPDDAQRQWAARRDAIRKVLGTSPPAEGAAKSASHKLGYAKLIRACVKDLEDAPAQLSVKLTEIGAPDVGTIVAAAEVISTTVQNPAVTECVEQSMYAYLGDPPAAAYERTYRFGVALPGKKFTPEFLDKMFTQQMANRYKPVRRCEYEGVEGSIELEITIDKSGETEKVSIVESTVKESVGACLLEAAAGWHFLPQLAGTRRHRYALPVQAPVVPRE